MIYAKKVSFRITAVGEQSQAWRWPIAKHVLCRTTTGDDGIKVSQFECGLNKQQFIQGAWKFKLWQSERGPWSLSHGKHNLCIQFGAGTVSELPNKMPATEE